MKIIPAFCFLNKVILVQAVPFHSHYKPPTSLFLTLSFIFLIRPLKFVWMESPWIYEYLFETKFIQGCRPVSFHCLLRLLALLLHSAPNQMLAALKTCNSHKTDLRGIGIGGWHSGRQDKAHVVWALKCFLPLYCQTVRLNKAGHWDLSSQTYQQSWKDFLG